MAGTWRDAYDDDLDAWLDPAMEGDVATLRLRGSATTAELRVVIGTEQHDLMDDPMGQASERIAQVVCRRAEWYQACVAAGLEQRDPRPGDEVVIDDADDHPLAATWTVTDCRRDVGGGLSLTVRDSDRHRAAGADLVGLG